MKFWKDGLMNLVANLGTSKDKAANSYIAHRIFNDVELQTMYRNGWLPRKIVDIPAMDATRRWRTWNATQSQIKALVAEETRHQVRAKIQRSLILSRLYGACGTFINIRGQSPDTPLDVKSVGRGDLESLVVIPHRFLSDGEIDEDFRSIRFDKPKYWNLHTNKHFNQKIHHSRMLMFYGAPLPDNSMSTSSASVSGGDSVIQAVYEAMMASDNTTLNIQSLVFEAKIDVIKIPGLMENVVDPDYESKLLKRFTTASMNKSNNNALLLDKEEEYEQKKMVFQTLPEIMDRFFQNVSGASDIPMTRLFGMSPGGFNSTGDGDLKNYYDRIQSLQTTAISPEMHLLDEVIIRSANGSRPRDTFSEWTTLWQANEKEESEIARNISEAIENLKGSRVLHPRALSKAVVNYLSENNILPGIEEAFAELTEEDVNDMVKWAMEENPNKKPPQEPAPRPDQRAVSDASPRSLYVYRPVLNANEIIEWAKSQGFETTLAPEDMHVTIAYSREPLDWSKVGSAWDEPDDGKLTVPAGGMRMMEKYNDATVLLFTFGRLDWRHHSIRDAGASWDHPDYTPHITITYNRGDVDLDKVVPFRGKIELGPEVFEDLDDQWKYKVVEQ